MSFWPLTFIWLKMSICGLVWVKNFSISFYRWTEWGFQRNVDAFYCGFFSFGAAVQQLLPAFTKTELWPSRENILFHFSRSVVKGLGTLTLSSSHRSLTLLSPPPLSPLSPLLLTSGPVKPHTGGEMEGVWLLGELCVFTCVSAIVIVFPCARVCPSALLSIWPCVHVSLCDSVCALFKPTVAKALQGSLCIIGDLLLSAHCIWQIWIGDCQADMLINDNHNWYLLIAKDEKSSTAERKRVTMTNTHTCTFCTDLWLQVWSVFMCHLCLCTFRPFLTPWWSNSNQPMVEHDGASCLPTILLCFHVCEYIGGMWICRGMALVMCVI